jgi:antirestriction protein ArdC
MLDFTPLERCEAIVKGMPNPPKMDEKGGGRCYYQPATDAIHMSDRRSFNSVEEWYGTLFHELIHATGHKTRTGRIQDWASKGSDNYAREELVAEIGSAFLRARAGIEAPPLETNSVAYIANWLGKLRNDPKLVVLAAGAAQKGADWVLGETFKTTEDAEPDEVEDEAVAEVAA